MQTLTISANIQPSILGKVQGGIRVDLTYLQDDSQIRLTVPAANGQYTRKKNRNSTANYGGFVVAGHDWALVRDDAVIMFDGTVTFAVNVGVAQVPIIMEIEGRIDLTKVYQKKEGEQTPYSDPSRVVLAWGRGDLEGWTLPVRLFLQFTVDQKTPEGLSLASFERTTFFADGTYKFGNPATIQLTAVPAAAVSIASVVKARRGVQAVLKPANNQPMTTAPRGANKPTKPKSRTDIPDHGMPPADRMAREERDNQA